jgi:tRNA modification GTPase
MEAEMEDTITAISTAAGNGGIGIVRLSGKDSFKIINKIFKPKNGDNKIEGYRIKYGNIIEPETGKIIDEVLVSFFVNPKSYTKEDMCEINTHGGMVIEKEILELCIKCGARIAEPGEFTKRAFLNGRIDLSQAEAISDLISSKSRKEAQESVNQLEGSLSKRINEINDILLNSMVNINVTIDYPEYDVPEVTNNEALKDLKDVKELLIKLEKSFDQGKLIKDGIKTVILGKPNSGKSSLLNSILNEDRAIVSNIEGTTRDTIEEFVNINGLTLKLIDTAGIRNTDNEIEKIGVEKSKKMAEEADLIIAMFDLSRKLDKEDKDIISIIKDKTAIIVLNKVDVSQENKELEEELEKTNKPIVKISAVNKSGIDDLYNEINKLFELDQLSNDNNILITNERHKMQINKATKNIDEAIKTINENMPVDIISIYIKQAMDDLGEITGTSVTDDIINEIFKKFCLGK